MSARQCIMVDGRRFKVDRRWTDREVAIVRADNDAGVTVGETAQKLGRSKAMVAGKRERLGLTMPERSPIRPRAELYGPPAPPRRRVVGGQGRQVIVGATLPLPVSVAKVTPPPPPSAEEVARRLIVARRQELRGEGRRCQYIQGDRRPWIFCDEPVAFRPSGSPLPYCAEHARRCFGGWGAKPIEAVVGGAIHAP